MTVVRPALLLSVPVLAAVVACHTEPAPVVTLPTAAATTGTATAATTTTMIPPAKNTPNTVTDYFPDEAHGGFSDFVRDWYGKHLRTMGEPSLWEASRAAPARETWRFTWLRTWGHPVAIRFDVDGAAATMRYVELDGSGGYAPGRIVIDRTTKLSAAEWSRVASAIGKAGFWSLPTTVQDAGLDGLQWVIEGTAGGKYHVTDRWTPSYETARRGLADYQAACRAAFDVAKAPGTFE